MTSTPQPDDTEEAMTNQSPAEALDAILEKLWEDAQKQDTGSGLWKPDRIRKAKNAVTAYAATVEREARIDEIKRPMTLHVELMSSADFKAGFSEALDQIDKADELRVAALQGPEDEAEGKA